MYLCSLSPRGPLRSWKRRPALTTTLLLVGSFQLCVGAAGIASPEEGRSHSSRFKGKAKMPAAGTVFVKATSLSSLKTLHSSGHYFWAPLHFKALLYKWMHKQNKIFFIYWAGRLVTEPCKTADIKLFCLMKMATVNNSIWVNWVFLKVYARKLSEIVFIGANTFLYH